MPRLHHTLLACLGTVLLTAAGAAGQDPTAPQDTPAGPRARTPQTDDPRPVAGRPGREATETLEKQGVKPSDADAQVMRKIALEQSKYRKRKGQIKRLRELAKADGNEQRLAKLDELEARINRLHEQKLDRWRQRLGKEKFDRVNRQIERDSKKGKAKGKGKDKVKGKADATDDAGEVDPKQPAGRGVEGPLERIKRTGQPRDAGSDGKPREPAARGVDGPLQRTKRKGEPRGGGEKPEGNDQGKGRGKDKGSKPKGDDS